MTTPTRESLEALDQSVSAKLIALRKEHGIIHDPIMDGAVDAEQYVKAEPRILWILKEPWEILEEGETGGDYRGSDFLKKVASNRGTHTEMAYITYSILNGYIPYKDIPYVTESEAVASVLNNVACINISKFPGGTSSDMSDIAKAYSLAREILLEQIEGLSPAVIIGGNTLPLFYKDLELQDGDFFPEGSAASARCGDRLYIHAYHPAQMSLGKDVYCDEIVSIVRKGPQPCP